MGGLKRKIPTDKKIEKKETKSVAFSKRRKGLYSKTAQLCLLSGAQVAILATPVCPESSVSFYSFGHSSVDSVVSAFLANQRPPEDLGSEFWWEDESLAQSNNSEDLSEAVDSISRMLQNLKGLRSAAMANREDMKKKEVVVHGTHEELDQDQTLNFQSTSSASPCIQDDSPENFERFAKSSEQTDQIVATSDRNNNGLPGNLDAFNLDQFVDSETNWFSGFITTSLEMDDVFTNRYPRSDSEGAEHAAMLVHSKFNKDDLHFSELKEDQIVAISDNNNNNLYGSKQEVDIDQIFDICDEF